MINEIECVPSRDQKEATRNAHSKFTANDEFGFQFKANRICNAHDLLANSIILNDKCHHHNRITGSRWNHTVFTRTNQRFFLTVQLCKRKLAASEKKSSDEMSTWEIVPGIPTLLTYLHWRQSF